MFHTSVLICLTTALLSLAVFAAPAAKTGSRRDLLDDLLGIKVSEPEDVLYDQRQNGTENYRLNINGVMFVVAPPESLISAAQLLDFGSDWDPELTEFEFESSSTTKPDDLEVAISTHKPVVVPAPGAVSAPEENAAPSEKPKSMQRVRQKLRFPGSQFILPFIRRRPHY